MDQNNNISEYNYNVRVGGSGKIIDVSNPDDTGAQGWRYDAGNKTIIIFTPSDYTLTGTTTENKVQVMPEAPADTSFNIILMGVNIDKSGEANSPAISIKGGVFCRLLLYQNSELKSGLDAAAIQVSYDSSLLLDGLLPDRDCYLRADTRGGAACIGANNREKYGNITIKNVRMYLKLYELGTGLGYGNEWVSGEGNSGSIKILGGNTQIQSFNYGTKGISCKNLEITSGKLDITANSGIVLNGTGEDCEVVISGDAEVNVESRSNAGIYYNAAGGTGRITILDGVVTARCVSYNSPGISCYIADGSIGECKLLIHGGVVTAYGGYGAAGIGSGNGEYSKGDIEITGGVITAFGGNGGSGIGTGMGGQSNGKIEITGGIICAHGADGGAGIGAGSGGKVNHIFISSKAKVMAESHEDNTYDIGGYYKEMNQYTGLYTGMYSGELSGIYQGRLSGLFKGKLGREYTDRLNCRVSGFYTGKATGTYSGLFSGRYSGGLRPAGNTARSIAGNE